MFYVYLLRSVKDKKLYIGYSANLKRRISEHNSSKSRSTKLRRPFELVYYEAYKAESDARKREAMLKEFSNAYSGLKRRLRASLAKS